MKARLKKYLKIIGPGFVTGASDDDPSGIATYAQTGAIFGYSQLWTALYSYPFTTVIQEMCGRIGVVTGKGLSGVIRKYYSKPVLFGVVGLLFIANTINIGADLGAMASAGQMLWGIPFNFWLIAMAALTLVLEVFVSYKTYAKFLKYLTLSLFAYVITAFIVKQDWVMVIKSTLVPTISLQKDYLLNIVAILGTTISPYLFFWQTGEEVEEEVEAHKLRTMGEGIPRINNSDIHDMQKDTIFGMLFSNLVMFFIIATTAATLHTHGITNIETATQAAQALRPLAGDFSFLLFALGVIGTGLLAMPVLAGSASYAISEAFGWREGLSRKFNKAPGFYAVIAIATVVGLLINFLHIPPFKMLYYSAVTNGIIAPPLLIMIVLIARNQNIMGKHTSTGFSTVMGWIIAGVMGLAALLLLYTQFFH